MALTEANIAGMTMPAEVEEADVSVQTDELIEQDRPWVVVVWNDPINLTSYVAFVFRKVFGFTRSKAQKLMLNVHEKGRANVFSGSRSECEKYVNILHSHGLWATMEHDK